VRVSDGFLSTFRLCDRAARGVGLFVNGNDEGGIFISLRNKGGRMNLP